MAGLMGQALRRAKPLWPTTAAFGPFIDEAAVTQIRHLLELRVAEALPADSPVFTSSRVSRFRFGENEATSFTDVDKDAELEQLEVNPPNLPLFKQGTLPLCGAINSSACSPGQRRRIAASSTAPMSPVSSTP